MPPHRVEKMMVEAWDLPKPTWAKVGHDDATGAPLGIVVHVDGQTLEVPLSRRELEQLKGALIMALIEAPT